ncbi:MAG: prolipoprotein diacylglyceryl transferase [Thermoleophilaceae bacterium]|nr:prolipoprotein diacylglyceryl transferase [Thermoleophilaceae bacterium]
MQLAVITVGIDPEIQLGPLSVAWHGLTIAIGIAVGGVVAAGRLRRRGVSTEPLATLGVLLVVGGIVGGRLFYVLEHGGPLLGTRGFTFDGGFILAAVLIAGYVRRAKGGAIYIDAVALALPLGVAIGRIGDVINGEHYGPQSDFFLAVRNSNPEAFTPNPALAYHSGGLYEVILGLLVFAVVWTLRDRLPRTGDLAWTVLGLFALGRFFEFFARSDSPDLALGLNNAQWTSLLLLAVAIAGRTLWARRATTGPFRPGAAH